jgi:hypothetical protein
VLSIVIQMFALAKGKSCGMIIEGRLLLQQSGRGAWFIHRTACNHELSVDGRCFEKG